MTRENLIELLKHMRTELAGILGSRLVAVYLYGSQARGDARPDADIDVLVVHNGDFNYFDMVERTGEIVTGLSLDYETVVSLAFTSKEEFAERKTTVFIECTQRGHCIMASDEQIILNKAKENLEAASLLLEQRDPLEHRSCASFRMGTCIL